MARTLLERERAEAMMLGGTDTPHVTLEYRLARPEDAATCIAIRAKTRENAISSDQLRAIGITAESWGEGISAGALPGCVCVEGGTIVGYCFGDRESGEVLVLAVLPPFECRGVGAALLDHVKHVLFAQGHRRLFLSCSPDPNVRSYGFYRHLGWRSTELFDQHGDEILECFPV